MENNGFVIIGIIIILALALCWAGYCDKKSREGFDRVNAKTLEDYFNGSTVGVKQHRVDVMACHPSCCGGQWPVPFDNLTANQVEKCIKEGRDLPTDFVRTNMTCARGANGPGTTGSGCPCVPKNSYEFLAKRGNNNSTLGEYVEPTFMIRANPRDLSREDQYNAAEEIAKQKSYYTEERVINDFHDTKEIYNPDALSSTNKQVNAILSKEQQLILMNAASN